MRIKIFGMNFYLKREVAILMTALIALIFFLLVFMLNRDNNKIEIKADGKTIEIGTSIEKEEISVYLIGCVQNPGIYKLKDGDILNDLIIAAGGFTEKADKENINLAYKMNENIMIKVLSIEEILENKDSNPSVAGGGIIITLGLTEELENNLQNGLININTCTIDELISLPGIGETRAGKIMDYRNNYGKFSEKEDIMIVDGIKEGIYNSLKDLIIVN